MRIDPPARLRILCVFNPTETVKWQWKTAQAGPEKADIGTKSFEGHAGIFLLS
jgi:hypothetical protein